MKFGNENEKNFFFETIFSPDLSFVLCFYNTLFFYTLLLWRCLQLPCSRSDRNPQRLGQSQGRRHYPFGSLAAALESGFFRFSPPACFSCRHARLVKRHPQLLCRGEEQAVLVVVRGGIQVGISALFFLFHADNDCRSRRRFPFPLLLFRFPEEKVLHRQLHRGEQRRGFLVIIVVVVAFFAWLIFFGIESSTCNPDLDPYRSRRFDVAPPVAFFATVDFRSRRSCSFIIPLVAVLSFTPAGLSGDLEREPVDRLSRKS